MENHIKKIVSDYVRSYPKSKGTTTTWQEPLVAIADAKDTIFPTLKERVSPTHALPEDFLADANSVITYFIPFERDTVVSNVAGDTASREWATAYVETNRLIGDLNEYICEQLIRGHYQAASIPRTHNYDKSRLVNDWSHRHVAFIAGLGTFGLNNMLVTEKGCCGRIGAVVTNLKLQPTPRPTKERCLYKYNGRCKKCVDRCVTTALTEAQFDRFVCHDKCLENGELFKDIGETDVCGKCLVSVPCSFINPTSKLP